MTQINTDNLNIEAAEREGLTPIRCRGCQRVLALQSADGNELRFNQNATSRGTRGYVNLKCECGYSQTWRPTRGAKSRNPNVSNEGIKSS